MPAEEEQLLHSQRRKGQLKRELAGPQNIANTSLITAIAVEEQKAWKCTKPSLGRERFLSFKDVYTNDAPPHPTPK